MQKTLADQFDLSILLVTYNHERYIDRAMESILAQELPADFRSIEIVVADDASQDSTRELIRRHEGRDPRFTFIHLPSDQNQGITRNYQRGFEACRGRYVAVLEGDDYWTSPLKLSKQLAVLEAQPDCVLCSTNYTMLQEQSGAKALRVTSTRGWRDVSVPELIADNLIGNFSTCVYRREVLAHLPARLFDMRSYDWIINICVGTWGRIVFLHEPLSVYRIHASGAWSGMVGQAKIQSQLDILPAYDELTDRRYQGEFNALAERLKCDLVALTKPKGRLSRSWKKIKTVVRGPAR